MKVDLNYLERGYYANLLRARSASLRLLAEERSMSATQQELRQEADYCEHEAVRLDRAEEPPAISDKEPIRVNARRDIDSVDATNTNGK